MLFEKKKRIRKKLDDWHDHYALLPTRIGNNTVAWLQNVRRRQYILHPPTWASGPIYVWQYLHNGIVFESGTKEG